MPIFIVSLENKNGKHITHFESVNTMKEHKRTENTIIVHIGRNEQYARMLAEEYANDFKELEGE